MLNFPLIKWHIQELYELLVIDPNNPMTVPLLIQLETMLNSNDLKQVQAEAPDVTELE